jgi:hypothetical protein
MIRDDVVCHLALLVCHVFFSKQTNNLFKRSSLAPAVSLTEHCIDLYIYDIAYIQILALDDISKALSTRILHILNNITGEQWSI